MARKANQIPAGAPVEENRQPAHAEAIASAAAGAPSGEGPGEVDTHEKVASEAGAVARAPEPVSADDRSAKPKDGQAGDGAGLAAPVPAGIPDEMRKTFPLASAAIDAWRIRHPDAWPQAVRITSSVDGFRRAGMAHPKGAIEHAGSAIFDPARLEQLLAEPKLTVEFV